MSLKSTLGVIGLSSLISFSAFAVDNELPIYKKVSGVSGNVSSVGSDTLANMMTFWAEEFKRIYPNVNVQIQAAGSSTAPPALTEATSNLGPMSRKMKSSEIEALWLQTNSRSSCY
jgi:phosphate transport system substrate-binding protein